MERRIFVHDLRITDPAPLVELMAHGTIDGVVFLTPTHFRQEFRDDKAIRGLPDVLPVGPPTKIIGLLDILVGTLEERDIFSHPIRSLVVADRGDRSILR